MRFEETLIIIKAAKTIKMVGGFNTSTNWSPLVVDNGDGDGENYDKIMKGNVWLQGLNQH